jgi:hypothetical protein
VLVATHKIKLVISSGSMLGILVRLGWFDVQLCSNCSNVYLAGVPSNMAVVAVYKLNLELKSIFLEKKNGMGSAASYVIAKTLLVTPILFLFSLAALGIPGFIIQNFPLSTFGRHILLWTVQIAMWESSAEAFAASFDDAVLGMLVHTAWWFAALLFSGFLVTVEDVSVVVLLGCVSLLVSSVLINNGA